MRTILIAIFLFFYFLVGIPIYLILFIIGKFSMEKRTRFAQCMVRGAFRIILFISGVTLDIRGLEKIDPDSTYLFIGNHRSYFDIIIGYAIIPCKLGFIAKKSLKKVPFLNWWMYFVNCLFLDRDNIKEGLKTILSAIAKVKDGISIFIFPEGTRAETDEMLPFHEGSFKIAQKSGCPVVPITYTNTAELFENHFPWVRPAHVIVEIGDPVLLSSLDKEDQKHPGVYFSRLIGETFQKNNR